VFYPVSVLPKVLQVFSRLIPASYVFESMRAILTGRQLHPAEVTFYLLIGFILAFIYLLLAYFFFIRVYRYNLRQGTIGRFNIE